MHMVFIGIVISLLVTEITGFSPGGVIVPGYLAMFVFQPVWLCGTLAAALAALGLIKLLERRLLLYGRRQFAMYVLTGIAVSQISGRLFAGNPQWDVSLLVIGYLIPGLIARDFARQGIISTTVALAFAVVSTRLLVLAGEGLLW